MPSMFGEAGSIASLVGVVVSVVGLGIAIWQIRQLRGEARAAKEASEATRSAVSRDLAIIEIARMQEQLRRLKELYRAKEWESALTYYPEIQRGLTHILYSYPNLPEDHSVRIQRWIIQMAEMESAVAFASGDITQGEISEFNRTLTEIQLTLYELESRLQQSV